MASGIEFESLQTSITTALGKARTFLIERATKGHHTGIGWRQFLDETAPAYKGTYGTSCGIVALISCDEDMQSPYIQGPAEWLESIQAPDGYWTTGSYKDARLTTITTWALDALVAAGLSDSEHVRKAVRWLIRTQHSTGGWGYYGDGEAGADTEDRITPTCLALNSLSKIALPQAKGKLELGAQRLAEMLREESEPAYLALGALALAGVGKSPYSIQSEQMINRLLGEIDIQPGRTSIESFYVPLISGEVIPVNYHLYTPAIILRAISTSYQFLTDERVKKLVKSLTNAMAHGYIEVDRMRGKLPIWAISETCRALQDYVRSVITHEDYLGLYEQIRLLLNEHVKLENEIKSIRKEIATLNSRVAVLTPFLNTFRKYGMYLAVLTITASYVMFRFKVGTSLWQDIAAILVAAGLTVIQFVSERRR